MRTLLSPRLVALHALVLVVVVVLVSLGLWQVRRLGEATARAETVAARLAEDPVDVTTLLGGRDVGDLGRTTDLASLRYRPVTATGTWQLSDEVLQRGRSHLGRAGYAVLTPLLLEDGSTLLVRRGTVPFDNDLRPPVPDAAPPAGPVTVTGTLETSVPQPTGPVAQRDPDVGTLEIVFNADLQRLSQQLDDPLLPMVLRADDPTTDGPLPLPEPRPEPDRGPHLSYAIQWFSFALIATGMYGLWLWRRARGDERAVAPTVTGDDD